MGRYSAGAETTSECIRLELSYLLKSKVVMKGFTTHGVLSWSSGAKIGYQCKYDDQEAWIKLSYTHKTSNEKTDYNYKIHFERKPSNLGKGDVLYFICPESQKSCRKLYMAYGYPRFKARQAYRNRIYYPDQLSSKLDRPNDIYWRLKREIEDKDMKHHKVTYNGKITKAEERLRKKRQKRDYYDSIRWNIEYLPSFFRNTFHLHGGNIEKMLLY